MNMSDQSMESQESAWQRSFTKEQRDEQRRLDSEAWNGIIGILLAIVVMGVTMGASVVLAITFLT